jgi:biotin carboxyl carrier protein
MESLRFNPNKNNMEEQKELQRLVIDGAMYQTTFTKKFENRPLYMTPDTNKIFSFIPGTVVDIFIKKGDRIEAGQTILILEAMKMFNNVSMPFNGKIVKVHVKPNEVVPRNHLMVEIRPI